MFTCSVCKETIGPSIKPVRTVVETRTKEYHNEFYREDEWGNREKHTVDSQGYETVKEMLLCPLDAAANGLEVPAQGNSAIVIGKRGFEEKPAPPLRPKLIALVAASALDRVAVQQPRAQRDSEVAIPIIKWFSDNNKGYVF